MPDPKPEPPEGSKNTPWPNLGEFFAAVTGKNVTGMRVRGNPLEKLSKVWIFIAIAFPAIVVAGIFIPWLAAFALILLIGTWLTFCSWSLSFSEKNPHLSTFSEAELFAFEEQRLQIAMKGHPQLLTIDEKDLAYNGTVKVIEARPELEKPDEPPALAAPDAKLQLNLEGGSGQKPEAASVRTDTPIQRTSIEAKLPEPSGEVAKRPPIVIDPRPEDVPAAKEPKRRLEEDG